MDETVKVGIELEADESSVKKFTDHVNSAIKQTVVGSISDSLSAGINAAVEKYDRRYFNKFKESDDRFGGFATPGDFASYLLESGKYAPSNATSLSTRRMLIDLVSNRGRNLGDPEEMILKAEMNAASHAASDQIRLARVQGRYDTNIRTAQVALQVANAAKTPEEYKAAMSIAASATQAIGNQSFVNAGIISSEEAVSNRMIATTMRKSVLPQDAEDRLAEEQVAWEREQRRAKELEYETWWSGALLERDRKEEESRRYKEISNAAIPAAIEAFIDASSTGDRKRIAEFYKQQDILGKYYQGVSRQVAAASRGEAMPLQQFIDATQGGTGQRAEFAAYYGNMQAMAMAKVFEKVTKAAEGFGKVLTTTTNIASQIVKDEWGISSDLSDPFRTRRATRQRQAQQYGNMALNLGASLMASGNPYAMAAGGVIGLVGGATQFLGARNEARREAMEKYTAHVMDFNTRRLLYGPNVNFTTAQTAGLSGYTSAESMLNLDTTAANLQGAMAFGAVGETQMMALSMMPNYWKTLMDPNASTRDRMEAYAQDMNALPQEYQAYINSILPGGDESLRAYSKTGAYQEAKFGYGTDDVIDRMLEQYGGQFEHLQIRKSMRSRQDVLENFYKDVPKLIENEYEALGERSLKDKAKQQISEDIDLLYGGRRAQESKEDQKVLHLTVNVNDEERANTYYTEKDFSSQMSYSQTA